MRAALDVTPLLGARTGIGQFVHALLDALERRPDGPELVPYVLSGRARRRRGGLPAGTRVLPMPAAALVRCWARADRPVADRWLGGVDVVHGTNFVVPPMRAGARVTSVQDTWCLREPERCSPAVRLFGPVVRRAVARGAWVHASSAFVAGEVRELLATDRVVVVPYGVPDVGDPADAARVALPAGVRAPYVVALGALDARKNLATLVRAFAAVEASDVQLVLAGPDGTASAEVDAAIAALPGERRRRVVRVGMVSDAERRALLHGAAVLAYPSLYEGFGFPVLEAMAAGVPVVCTTAGAVPEVAGDAALLVDPHDADALAGALTRALTDGAVRADLTRRGRARAAAFTWEATAEGMLRLWRQVTT